jgi:O-antigen chain-terminating methyltransferase
LATRRDLDLIEAELQNLGGAPWNFFRSGRTSSKTTERVVEIPWVLSRYSGEQRVLDVGPAYASFPYIRHLLGLGIADLHGLDLSPVSVRGMTVTRSDIREMPYPDEWFPLINCISTLEHVGLDVSRYEVNASENAEGDVAALKEIKRVLARGGRLLITVPFGRRELERWYRQYDDKSWTALVREAGLATQEQAVFGYSEGGWARVDDIRELRKNAYAQGEAPAATGVLCASLVAP